MKIRNDAESWGWPARLLHWTVAVLIVFLLALGFYMANFVDDLFERFALTQTHKSWGFIVFALGLARMGWRLANPVSPHEPAGARPWETAAARLTHVAFYVLLALMPLSGWLMSSASPLQDTYNIQNRVFDWFVLPDPFVPGSETLETVFHAVHFWGGVTLAALLAVHAGAALKHHFIERDAVLRRMIWGR